MIYASDVNYPFSVSTIKLAILLFYLRLFGSRTGFRKVLYVTGALVISWFIGKSFTAPLQVHSHKRRLRFRYVLSGATLH